MPDIRRDPHSKALIFKPTPQENHIRDLTKSLEEKEKRLDALISKLEEKL